MGAQQSSQVRTVGVMQQRRILAERHRLMTQQQRTIVIYNGSDRVIIRNFNGRAYKMYPDGPFFDIQAGTLVTYDGELEIKDQWGPDPEAMEIWRKHGQRKKAPLPPSDFVIASVFDVVAHIIGKDERLGLVALTGDTPEENDLLKAGARERARTMKRADCERLIDNHRARSAGLQPNDPGRFMRNDELEADRWLTANGATGTQKRIPCTQGCGYWSYLEADIEPHVARAHPEVVHGPLVAAAVSPVAAVVAPPTTLPDAVFDAWTLPDGMTKEEATTIFYKTGQMPGKKVRKAAEEKEK